MFGIVTLLAGMYLITTGFLMQTNGYAATLFFKSVPLLLGIATLIISADHYGVLTLNM